MARTSLRRASYATRSNRNRGCLGLRLDAKANDDRSVTFRIPEQNEAQKRFTYLEHEVGLRTLLLEVLELGGGGKDNRKSRHWARLFEESRVVDGTW